jgi:hypothetical protein
VYDGTTLHMSTADAPDTVIARADTCGFITESWDVTAYRASITSTETPQAPKLSTGSGP